MAGSSLEERKRALHEGMRYLHVTAAKARAAARIATTKLAGAGSSWTRTNTPMARTNTPNALRNAASGIFPARRAPTNEPRIAAAVTPDTRAQSKDTVVKYPPSPAKDFRAMTTKEEPTAT